MSHLSIFLLTTAVIFSFHEPCSANPFLTAVKAVGLAQELVAKISDLQSAMNGPESDDTLNSIDKNQLEFFTDFHNFRSEILSKISTNLYTKLEVRANKVIKYTSQIQSQYEEMLEYLANPNKYPASELKNFAEVVTSSSLKELRSTIEKMHQAFAQKDIKNKSIIDILAEDSTVGDFLLETKKSLIAQK